MGFRYKYHVFLNLKVGLPAPALQRVKLRLREVSYRPGVTAASLAHASVGSRHPTLLPRSRCVSSGAAQMQASDGSAVGCAVGREAVGEGDVQEAPEG